MTACSMFMRRNGIIRCQVSGSRQYSRDLPQGGLEIPCVLLFSDVDGDVDKLKRVLGTKPDHEELKVVKIENVSQDLNPSTKKRRIDLEDTWVTFGNIKLTIGDKQIISNGDEPHDNHINMAQTLLSKQFPDFNGFGCTLVEHCMNGWKNNYIQIFHCRGNHWITVSTVGNKHSEVTIFDSLYKDVDKSTNAKICRMFKMSIKFNFPCIQVQEGSKDCGLFAIAYATHLAFNGSVNELLVPRYFNQSSLRPQLIDYLKQQKISVFT